MRRHRCDVGQQPSPFGQGFERKMTEMTTIALCIAWFVVSGIALWVRASYRTTRVLR